MTTSIAGPGMTGMTVAVILHFQLQRRKGSLQGRLDPLDPAHGSTLRNGRTSTRA